MRPWAEAKRREVGALFGCLCLFAAAAGVTGCDSGGSQSGGVGTGDGRSDAMQDGGQEPGDARFGERCNADGDCMELICVEASESRSVCSMACDPDDASTCPNATNWTCAQRSDSIETVCQCMADSTVELCEDGVDNDCNGMVDDCHLCRGELVGPEDDTDCDVCEPACGDGYACEEGLCACPQSRTVCDDGCFDLNDDDGHCGACDVACEATERCSEGSCVDVDECETGADDCDDATQDCVDVAGGYRCDCKSGFTMGDDGCVDVDECATSADDCAADACVNTTGGYECTCPAGYAGDGKTCADFDECDEQEDCGDHGACVNLVGSFECDCAPGYAFDGVDDCMVVNSCEAGLDEPAMKWCAGACRTLATDGDHCGDCNVDCMDGSCSGGQCSCTGGLDFCADAGCVDFDTDDDHCGGCSPCPLGASCNGAGVCQCDDGAAVMCPTVNPTECAVLAESEGHCGTCGMTCDVVCSASSCATADAVVAGGLMSCALLSDGRVSCWGDDANGALGDDDSAGGASDAPRPVSGLSNVTKLALGKEHACAIVSGGALWCWGLNDTNQVASADTDDRFEPVMVKSGVADVVAGESHTCVVRSSDGTIECTGDDTYGQRGDDSAVTASNGWTTVSGLSNVDKLVSGGDHLCALDDGDVFCWGDNRYGQLGMGNAGGSTDLFEPAKVSDLDAVQVDDLVAGEFHTCAIVGAAIKCWGLNDKHQLGVTGNQSSPTDVPGISTAVALYAGAKHSCARLSDDSVSCWGSRNRGRLGDGVTLPTDASSSDQVPIVGGAALVGLSLGYDHGCALDAAGEVLCWGDSAHRASGMTGDTSTPTELATW